MGEFEFISNYLTLLSGPQALDLKDDVAIWSPSHDEDAVISMDSIVEGVHFPAGKFDAKLAQKLIRVNVSDIVAKGAKPLGYFLSLCLPQHINNNQLKQFCIGLGKDQDTYGLKLWGGDTTRTSDLAVLSLTIIGTIKPQTAILRSGAQIGDVLCVSGTIGDAYLGLQVLSGSVSRQEYDTQHWENAYHIPQPPFQMRGQIRKFANAALDISDGLIADTNHLVNASKVGAQLILPDIPLSPISKLWLSHQKDKLVALSMLASGGDDYQALMTLSPDQYANALADGMSIAKIGYITKELGVRCYDAQGNEVIITKAGYTHF